jgi:hypothetical protein
MNELRNNKKKILIRLSKGCTSIDELTQLQRICNTIYKKNGKGIDDFINAAAFTELSKRLKSSVFGESAKDYPSGFVKYCIAGEYKNTKSFIQSQKDLLVIVKETGDITSPKFYGLDECDFVISLECIIHIVLRHNPIINSFINPDSKIQGHNPSSFSWGVVTEPMMLLFMSLKVLKKEDWISAQIGKNLICHVSINSIVYTIIRKGSSNEIISFYPRNDKHDANVIRLKRNPDKMEMILEN